MFEIKKKCVRLFQPSLIKIENIHWNILDVVLKRRRPIPDRIDVTITENYCFKRQGPGFNPMSPEISSIEGRLYKRQLTPMSFRPDVGFQKRTDGEGTDQVIKKTCKLSF